MSEHIEFHLIDAPDPEASIDFDLLGPLATVFGLLSQRLVRWQVDRSGPGRSPGTVARIAKVRLVTIESGSTTLVAIRGSSEMLPSLDDVGLDSERTLWSLLQAMVDGVALVDVPPAVAASVLDFADALEKAAPTVVVASRDHPEQRVVLRAGHIARDPWIALAADSISELRTVSGVLQAVDLTRRTFRVHDDAGNRIHLGHVEDVDAAGALLGQRVLVRGRLQQVRGQWRVDPMEELVVDPGTVFEGPPDLAAELAKTGPVPAAGELLTDDEFDDFLAAVRGQ